MGRFPGLGGIKTNRGKFYFLPGNYVVDLEEIKFFRAMSGKDTFVIAAKIVESDNPERKPGQTPSQVITVNPQYLETCMGDVKQFLGSLLGLTDINGYQAQIQPGETQDEANDRFWDQALEAVVSPQQVGIGKRMCLSCYPTTTRAGGRFTKHIWAPYTGGAQLQPQAAPAQGAGVTGTPQPAVSLSKNPPEQSFGYAPPTYNDGDVPF